MGETKDPLADRIIDKYKIVEKIGGGGFGAVYRAEHFELQTPFAIKILHAHLVDNETMVQRFRREAVLLGGLSHPNIVKVIDFGFLESVGFYIVMEWLEGKTLQSRVKEQGLLDPDTLVDLFEQLLDALSYAHSRGVVHRDLKPENLLLIQSKRGRRTLKVLDFGIARMIEEQDEHIQVTEAGLAVGTPRYMAPEQAAGDVELVDHRTDLYCCGVMLVELLTGKPLFTGTTNEILLKHMDSPPPTLTDLAPDKYFSPQLEYVVSRVLSKKREARHQSADDFANELFAALAEDHTAVARISNVVPALKASLSTPQPVRVPALTASPLVSSTSEAIDLYPDIDHSAITGALTPNFVHTPVMNEREALDSLLTESPSALRHYSEPTPPSLEAPRPTYKPPATVKSPEPQQQPPRSKAPKAWIWMSLAVLMGLCLALLVIWMLPRQKNNRAFADTDASRGLPPLPRGPNPARRTLLPGVSPQRGVASPGGLLPSMRRPSARRATQQTPPRAVARVSVKRPVARRVARKSPPRRRRWRRWRRRRVVRRRVVRRRVVRRQVVRRAVPRRVVVQRPVVRRSTRMVRLTLVSKPGGATVWVNGARRGKTPLTVQVPYGSTARVLLKKSGYLSKRFEWKATGDARKSSVLAENIF